MLIVEVSKSGGLDKALKILKHKVIKSKQNEILFNRKEHTKKSVKKRMAKLRAIHREEYRREN